jgi:adenylate kinase family enzyme
MSVGMEIKALNDAVLHEELAWFKSYLDYQIPQEYSISQEKLNKKGLFARLFSHKEVSPPQLPLPDLADQSKDAAYYVQLVKRGGLIDRERLILMLALAPRIQRDILDVLKNIPKSAGIDVGGVQGKKYDGFLPTIQTALYLLGETSIYERFEDLAIFNSESTLVKNKLIKIVKCPDNEPFESSQVLLTETAYQLITQSETPLVAVNTPSKTVEVNQDAATEFVVAEAVSDSGNALDDTIPPFSSEFPAKEIKTTLHWETDLVLDDFTKSELKKIEHWWALKGVLAKKYPKIAEQKKGLKVLFYGKPGTGKTLTATLLGQKLNLPVFRIDSSSVVSKYIGETEKNLEKVFQQAEGKDWILFFDEADALFGKRTNVADAHDRYNNQEIAYLLQRIEDYPNLVILASNMDSNLDDAFGRRFSKIFFPLPKKAELELLWKKNLAAADWLWVVGESKKVREGESEEVVINAEYLNLLTKEGLSGSNIVNIINDTLIYVLSKKDMNLEPQDIPKEEEQKQILRLLYQRMLEELNNEGKSLI